MCIRDSYTGNAPANYAVYATTKYTYDYAGDLTQVLQPDGATKTTYQYDMAGRKTGMTDPDRGTETYAYDQNGNPTQSTDARGSAGTVYAGYDGIDRPIWRNTTNSPTGAYDTYSYDSTASGNVGIGRLTSQTFSGAPNNTLSGSDSYVYDARGRQYSETLVIGTTNYPIHATYDDAGTVLTRTYPDGETVTNSYSAQDWITGVSTSQGSTTLLSGASYTGPGGAIGSITSANLGGTTYRLNATYDLLGRASDVMVKRSSDQATMFDQSRTFDAAGNVTTASITMPAGTDNQAFCYDEQNRLTWAGAVGTPPCTGTGISAGTLTAAQYTQTVAYDTMGRLTSGPLGAYTYGDSAHVHAATSIGSTYTSAYDAAGDMTCRAPSSGVTCSGTQTGAQLNYNNEGELSNWQNTPSNPTSTAAFLYDGLGNRVAQQSTQSGTSTTTAYVGNLEEDSTTGTTTTKTTYYYANGSRIAMAVNGAFSYLASDGLGSANVTLNGSGAATASMLYAPYGSARYSSGTMPTDYGFTGQHADSNTGLDYYNARYYDPTAGQFASADTALPGNGFDIWGLSRYAYVEGNPVMRTDPTGNVMAYAGGGGGCYPCSSAPKSSPSPSVTWWNPFTYHWSAAVHVAKTQVPTIHADPGGAQDNLIALGRNLHGPARSFYVSALSTARDWTGGETADLYSGDPGRVLRATAGAVLFAANFVPGVGEGANAAKDVGQIAIDEAVSHAPQAEHAVQDLAETCAVNSFTAGTLVLMADGSKKPIEQLKAGDKVMAGDAQKGSAKPETIQQVIVGHGLKHLYVIHVDGGTIEATYNHPFWVTDKSDFEWAQDLKPGEHLLLADGRAPPITEISHHDEITTVFNLSIQEIHTFYVGPNAVLVHNSCITTTANSLQHIVDTHIEGGPFANPAEKGIFAPGESPAGLVSEAESTAPYGLSKSAQARTVFAGRLVGFERSTGQGTMLYTVVTNMADRLLTAYPGVP